MKSVELTEKSIKGYDCLLIATNHSVYDYKWILKNANLIVDTRNAIKESSSNTLIGLLGIGQLPLLKKLFEETEVEMIQRLIKHLESDVRQLQRIG